MDNSHTFFPFNGQFPNMNLNDINGMMKQVSQLMEGDFMQSLQQLSQLQNSIPHTPGFPIMPMNFQARGETQTGEQSGAQPPFNMNQLQAMMERLGNFLNNDLMRNMYNLQTHTPNYSNIYSSPSVNQVNPSKNIPIQLWENNQQMYLLVSIPGLKNSDDVKVVFVNDRKVQLRAKTPTYRPERNSRMVRSEFPKGVIEREVELPQAVSTKSYSSNYVDGLYTLTLNKLEDDIEISIFDE